MAAKRKRNSKPQQNSETDQPESTAPPSRPVRPHFPNFPEALQEWDFYARIESKSLIMIPPHTHDLHFTMLLSNENSAVAARNQSIPLDHQREKLKAKQAIHAATRWSDYFYDTLHGHPRNIRQPKKITGCHIIGLFNSDLIIDAISTRRPTGMYWTFDRTTNLLQKVSGNSLRGGWKEPPVHLGDLPGYEHLRLPDREENDILPRFAEKQDEPKT
jgi:hypothetical protein